MSDRYIKLPKIGLVRVKRHRNFEGIIKSVTVSKTPSGKYYVSVLVDCEEQKNYLNLKIKLELIWELKNFALHLMER